MSNQFKAKVPIEIHIGRFLVKTITTQEELHNAFLLRYQVFQVEMIGKENIEAEDQDEYDMLSDHLAIIDTKTNVMIATCRMNCSLFSNKFYSSQEFECDSLLQIPGVKSEIGRVCVHKDFRKGIIIMLLWRAIADYLLKTETMTLFGCGSVMTEDPQDALVLYKYLLAEGKVRTKLNINPTQKYRYRAFEELLQSSPDKITDAEKVYAESILPPLCKSYFDIGCYISGPPAFDKDFKCIDFLTILENKEIDPKIRMKMLGY